MQSGALSDMAQLRRKTAVFAEAGGKAVEFNWRCANHLSDAEMWRSVLSGFAFRLLAQRGQKNDEGSCNREVAFFGMCAFCRGSALGA